MRPTSCTHLYVIDSASEREAHGHWAASTSIAFARDVNYCTSNVHSSGEEGAPQLVNHICDREKTFDRRDLRSLLRSFE